MERALGLKPALVHGAAGTFDVAIDDSVIYSRHRTGGFPDEASLIEQIRRLRGA